MASKVVTTTRTPTRSSARTPARSSSAVTPSARTSTRTPGRRAASRATSSPKSLEVQNNLAVASRRETVCSPREMHEDNSLTERPTTIEVMDQLQEEEEEEEEEEEDIISGNTMNLAPSLTPRHKRLQQVASASPDLSSRSKSSPGVPLRDLSSKSKSSPGVPLIPIYSSPASSSSKPAASPASVIPTVSPSSNPLSYSPSVEEMERMLGINADSPGAQDCFDMTTTASNSTTVKKPAVKKSIRRTTMITSEIFDGVTLADRRKDQQSLAMGNPNRRRSSRVERVYYGSPSNIGKSRDQEKEASQFKHPLMVKENWKVLAGRQKTHNNNILTLLNTANAAMLTKLPAVGPKSAFVLQQYRDLHDGIKTIGELKDIPGLSRNFFDKFCTQNQVKEVLEEEEGEVL